MLTAGDTWLKFTQKAMRGFEEDEDEDSRW
jgi:hypothetical protein